jgi:hypothetical protein
LGFQATVTLAADAAGALLDAAKIGLAAPLGAGLWAGGSNEPNVEEALKALVGARRLKPARPFVFSYTGDGDSSLVTVLGVSVNAGDQLISWMWGANGEKVYGNTYTATGSETAQHFFDTATNSLMAINWYLNPLGDGKTYAVMDFYPVALTDGGWTAGAVFFEGVLAEKLFGGMAAFQNGRMAFFPRTLEEAGVVSSTDAANPLFNITIANHGDTLVLDDRRNPGGTQSLPAISTLFEGFKLRLYYAAGAPQEGGYQFYVPGSDVAKCGADVTATGIFALDTIGTRADIEVLGGAWVISPLTGSVTPS